MWYFVFVFRCPSFTEWHGCAVHVRLSRASVPQASSAPTHHGGQSIIHGFVCWRRSDWQWWHRRHQSAVGNDTKQTQKTHTPKLPCMCQLTGFTEEIIDMRSISLACTPPPPANRSNTVCGDDLSVAHHFLWMHILDGLIYHLSTVAFSAISTERLSRVRMSCNL